NKLWLNASQKVSVKLPKGIYLGIKKGQYVRKNKTRFAAKLILNKATDFINLGRPLVKLANEVSWDKIELEF
ncbi:hypothetical protein SL054_001890, partial [Flavobacterium psychrophilum]|nr:hypothetical protein [Flavobacterium psychrophilum]ELY1992543.1 hypothetical protein [Flavobacterium psychrophilum]